MFYFIANPTSLAYLWNSQTCKTAILFGQLWYFSDSQSYKVHTCTYISQLFFMKIWCD